MRNTLKAVACVGILLSTSACSVYPPYRVWAKRQDGLAQLAEADGNRQIKVQEAKAALESAGYLADAEVRKAEGVAKANQIMSASLGGPEGYLRWKYIEMLQENHDHQVIYVPTEGALPILEAGKRPEAQANGH